MATLSAKSSFPFESLSTELKQMVFREAFEAVDFIIRITLTADGTTLICTALNFLVTLQKVDESIYKQARDYLFETHFCFDFICETWPHWCLFKAFRNHANVGPDACRIISRIKLSRFTVCGLIDPELCNKNEPSWNLGLCEPGSCSIERHPYFNTLPGGRANDGDAQRLFSLDIKSGLTRGILYATFIFPMLRELRFSLDVVDCLPFARPGHYPLSDSINYAFSENMDEKSSMDEQIWKTHILDTMCSLQPSKLMDIDLHIHWDDFVRRYRTYDVDFPLEQQKKCQDILTILRAKVRAKSITSHSES